EEEVVVVGDTAADRQLVGNRSAVGDARGERGDTGRRAHHRELLHRLGFDVGADGLRLEHRRAAARHGDGLGDGGDFHGAVDAGGETEGQTLLYGLGLHPFERELDDVVARGEAAQNVIAAGRGHGVALTHERRRGDRYGYAWQAVAVRSLHRSFERRGRDLGDRDARQKE